MALPVRALKVGLSTGVKMAIREVRCVGSQMSPVVFVLPLGVALRCCWHVICWLSQADRGSSYPNRYTAAPPRPSLRYQLALSPRRQQLLASDMLVPLAPALLVSLLGLVPSERHPGMHSLTLLACCHTYRGEVHMCDRDCQEQH